jgi:hypothetical protein
MEPAKSRRLAERLRLVLRPACVKMQLPPISWHSFRHSHATSLGKVGESLCTASAILMHSNLGTTMIYAHTIAESQKRAVDKVGAILFPSVLKFCVATEKREGQPIDVFGLARTMEPRARVELATCRLRIGCSTTELPRPCFNTIASAENQCQFFRANDSFLARKREHRPADSDANQ